MKVNQQVTSLSARVNEGIQKGLLNTSQASQLNGEIAGLGANPTQGQIDAVSADIYQLKQAQYALQLESEGKITAADVGTIQTNVANWAAEIRNGSQTLYSIVADEKSLIKGMFSVDKTRFSNDTQIPF